MSVAWTEEQKKVIDLQNRNILVSAAAGSGKTAVLVERIISMLVRENDPVDVDRLLIVTFTEAAAAEMKERIRDAIEKKLEENPENEHLKRQETLIHNAQITTIHSFCLSVIREHFHKIDLDPGFRIGEEGELKLLKHDVLDQLLESWYEEGEPQFLDFTEAYADGRDDKKLEGLLLKLYEFSRSYPDSEEWLKTRVKSYRIDTAEELEASPYFQTATENVRRYMESALTMIEEGIEVCRSAEGPYMYEEAFVSDRHQAEAFLSAKTYAEFYEVSQNIVWARLAPNRDKDVSEEKTAQAKAIREEVKGIIKSAAEQYFTEPLEDVLEGMKSCAPMMDVLARLTCAFAAAFEEAKRTRNIIDFDDMEQYALQILTDKTEEGRVPSRVAREYQEQFQEVMIDEYQDSNLIQETILTSVSGVADGRYNLFMVGDVKQSIYRFRLSRPELFMEKFDSYSLSDSKEQRIDLHKNFRSRKEVLDSVNFLFRQIMTRSLGGVVYDDQAALYVGADYAPVPGNETEVLLVDTEYEEVLEDIPYTGNAGGNVVNVSLPARETEARAIAGIIKRLLDSQMVTDKKNGELRPVRHSDIVILTRSVKGFCDVFTEVLMREGIPVCAGTREGYFETREIGVLLDYLSIINNLKQDIPLTAVLRSFFGGFCDEELAVIRSTYPNRPFWQAVSLYARGDEIENSADKVISSEKIRKKLTACLGQIEMFRQMVPFTSIHELLWKIMDQTGYRDYVSALPGGEQRRANLEMLLEKAMAFEGTSYKGLFNFIRYIEQLKKYEVDYGEAAMEDEQSDSVRIMSIHKSKGLEFPVVIVAGMSKRFNLQDTRGSVLIHAGLGVGLDSVDVEQRMKTPSFLKRVIQKEEVLETLGEELRVLYVALTRAKEKLIITGTLKEPDKIPGLTEEKKGMTETVTPLSFGRLSRVSSYIDWLLPALAGRGEKTPVRVETVNLPDMVKAEMEEEVSDLFTRKALEEWDTERIFDEEMRRLIEAQFSYSYPFDELMGKKLKFTVSELKKREYLEEEAGELLITEEPVVPLIPRFRKEEKEVSGASRGSAYHRVLELLDFTKDYDIRSLEKSIGDMAEAGRIAGEMAECVRPADVKQFLEGDAGQRMQRAARKGLLWKEQPFVLGVPMEEIYPKIDAAHVGTAGETILVQGIIDVYFEENDELVLLDYKTDKVYHGEQLVEKYHAQLEYYAKALEQITGKHVKEKIIYSITLGEEIRM